MSSNNGRTLKLFLVNGAPNGLLTAEIMNWTGHVITGPRSRLDELIQRPESKRTGVYFLTGPDRSPGVGTQVYIGETDDVTQRLSAHNRLEEKGGKDFWEKVCVVTSKDANLTKGHIKYLESRLIRIAQQAGRCELLNNTDPGYDNLPEADRSDMQFFLEQIQILLPVLGYDFLRESPKPTLISTHDRSATMAGVANGLEVHDPIFDGNIRKHGITAQGQEINGEFVVFKGSKARLDWEGVDGTYTNLFRELVRTNVIIQTADGLHREFSKDYAFSSPSAAAAVVAGRSANGRMHWLDSTTGQTYGAWQEARVSRVIEEQA